MRIRASVVVAVSILATLVAYFLVAVVALHSEGDFTGLVAAAARWLLWPAFLTGRIGISPGWPAILVAVLALVGFAWKLRGRLSGRRLPLMAASLAAGYALLGVAYFFLLPVPVPGVSLFDACGPALGARYRAAYAQAYHWGMYDHWVILDGQMAPAFSHGLVDGFLAGVREWESVFPPFTRSRVRRSLAAIRERHEGFKIKGYDICRDVPTQIWGEVE